MKKSLLCIAALLMCTTAVMATNSLQVSSNGRYLTTADGSPVYPQNDWATDLPWKATDAEITTYLTTRASQGFNLVSMYVVNNCNAAADYAASTNIAGIAPFALGGYDAARWNVAAPIEAYWARINTIIDTAAAQGLFVALAPLPTSGLLLGSYRCLARNDDAATYAFGNWLGKRYATKQNIVWLAGIGVPQNDWFNVTSQVNALAKGIADGVNGTSNNVGVTDYSTTLMTYDTERWSYTSAHWFGAEDWLDFNSVHEVPGRSGTSYYQIPELEADYALTPAKPTWLIGPVFQNQRGDGSFNAPQSRFQAYQTALAGGMGITYGNASWLTDLAGAADQMQYATAVLSPMIASLTPDQSLIVGSTGAITQGDSSSGWYMSGSTIIQAARTADGSNAVIYTAQGDDITINMDQLTYGTTMKAEWLDPRTGVRTFDRNVQSGVGAPDALFEAPGIPAQDNDAVLVLTWIVPEPSLILGGLLLGLAFLRRK